MEQFSVIRKHLKKKLDPRRFEHTLGVEFTCAALAMRYGYDIKKAQLAGLLHDCAKRYPGPELLRRCLEREIPRKRIRLFSMRSWEPGWRKKSMGSRMRRSWKRSGAIRQESRECRCWISFCTSLTILSRNGIRCRSWRSFGRWRLSIWMKHVLP